MSEEFQRAMARSDRDNGESLADMMERKADERAAAAARPKRPRRLPMRMELPVSERSAAVDAGEVLDSKEVGVRDP
jgi:hypothetical protein